MKVQAPKCPACGGWMYINYDESEEERVDVAPTIEIYWTCDCSRADTYPLQFTITAVDLENVIVTGYRIDAVQPRKKRNESSE